MATTEPEATDSVTYYYGDEPGLPFTIPKVGDPIWYDGEVVGEIKAVSQDEQGMYVTIWQAHPTPQIQNWSVVD